MYFGFNHMCRRHNVLFTMEHVERFDEITGCTNIRRFTKKLKEQNIRDLDAEERRQAIAEFTSLTIQMKYLQEAKQAKLVLTGLPQYQKSEKGPGRPFLKEKMVESNHKIELFFAPTQRNNNNSNNVKSGRRS